MNIAGRGTESLPAGLINLTSPSFSGGRRSRIVRTAGLTGKTIARRGRRRGPKRARRGRRLRPKSRRKVGRRGKRARRGRRSSKNLYKFKKTYVLYNNPRGRKKKVKFIRIVRRLPRSLLVRYLKKA